MPQTRRTFLELAKLGLLTAPSGAYASYSRLHSVPGIEIVDRLDDLSSLPSSPEIVIRLAVVLGAKSPFDGGGGLFVYDARGSAFENAQSETESQRGDWLRVPDAGLNSSTPTAQRFGAEGNIKADDTYPLQELIREAGAYAGDLGKAGYIPAGLYRLTRSLLPQSYSRLFGDGPHQSVLYNYQNPLPGVPAIRATDGLTFSTFENIGMQSQKAGFDVSGTTDHNTFRDLKLYGMTDAGFRFRGPLQTSLFDRVLFEDCAHGLVCEDRIVNRNTLREPEFKNCVDSAIKINGAEDLLVIGGRFEGRGSAGKAIIQALNVRLMTFLGGYFEGSHEYVVDAADSEGIISFDSVHFTYFRKGEPYRWKVSDGVRLIFRNCHSSIPMKVPASSILEGFNYNLWK